MDNVEVFVDGACENNDHNNPQAGCGVYWGPCHPLNWSEKLKGDKQTNNRAELSAAIMGIAQSIECGFKEIAVTTDSKYVRDGITQWIKEWKINKWKTTKKGDVLNKDLWLMLDQLQGKLSVNWRWVEGHKDTEGNIQADILAKEGVVEERCFLQEMAFHWYTHSDGNDVTPTNVVDKLNQPDCSQIITRKNDVQENNRQEYVCKPCNS